MVLDKEMQTVIHVFTQTGSYARRRPYQGTQRPAPSIIGRRAGMHKRAAGGAVQLQANHHPSGQPPGGGNNVDLMKTRYFGSSLAKIFVPSRRYAPTSQLAASLVSPISKRH